MEKTTIEINRTASLKNYGQLSDIFENMAQKHLEKILEWTKLPENEGKKVYGHIFRRSQESLGKVTERYVEGIGTFNAQDCVDVDYLDIYWQ